MTIIRTADVKVSPPFEGVCRARSIGNPEFVGYGPDIESTTTNFSENVQAKKIANPVARVVADFMILTDEEQASAYAEMGRVRRS